MINKMRIGFLRTCFGCCELRTGVIIIAIVDLIFGLYNIVDFAVRVYLDVHRHTQKEIQSNSTSILPGLHNVTQFHNSTKLITSKEDKHGALYDDSAFSVIVVGCIDLFISSFLLFVAMLRKYELRVIVFVAGIWGFVMAFLDIVSFGISIALKLYVEMAFFGIFGFLEIIFGYVILSYFKFMTVVVERGLDDINMSYYPEDPTTDFSEVQMDEAVDERPIMDDQDDFPMHGDDSRIVLT